MQRVVPYCDIIIGNSDEVQELGANFDFRAPNLYDTIRSLAEFHKINRKRSRIIMITQQEQPVVLFKGLFWYLGVCSGCNIVLMFQMVFLKSFQ